MAVKVTLKNGDVESFDGEDDRYYLYADGRLEVHRADGTVKTFMQGSFATVDGKRLETY
jgi:hypothetical protein